MQANHVLLEEIREINQRLIDTVVVISDEVVDPSALAAAADGSEGTIVKCSFSAVALSPSLKSQYMSAQMVGRFLTYQVLHCLRDYLFSYPCIIILQSPIQPLRLLVPTNYPNCSPILLDKFPVEVRLVYMGSVFFFFFFLSSPNPSLRSKHIKYICATGYLHQINKLKKNDIINLYKI